MKKIIIAIVAAITFALPSNAQINFGIKAGLNISKVSFKKDIVGSDNRCGFFVGPQMDITIPLAGLGADIAVLYDNKKINLNEGGVSKSETLNYIDLPINLKYTLGFSKLASVYFATGPQFAWCLGDKGIFENSYSLKSSQFSWNVGAGFTLFKKVRLGYTYNIPCGDTAELSVASGVTDAANFKNHNHQIHATYLF